MTESNFQKAAAAFSKQSAVFDSIEEENKILQWMRKQIHSHCMYYFKPGEKILELNCGTGIDAVYFAEHGLHIHATDISEDMLSQLKKKIEEKKLSGKISVQQCSFNEILKCHASIPKKSGLSMTFQYDHIFSDFGGLNCAEDLKSVIDQFQYLLKPGGTATLVIMLKVCPWEILSALKGNFKVAFRRFKKHGADSNVEGVHFKTFYYSPSEVKQMFGNRYRLLSLRGLASISPPPYMEKFPERFPRLYNFLTKADKKFCRYFPFNCWADHFIITMKMK